MDYAGTKTYAISGTAYGVGGIALTSVSIGYCWDDKGGFGTFITYAGIEGYADKRVDRDTITMGQFSAGLNGFFQYTSLESIDALNGRGASMGTSIGILGMDVVLAFPKKEQDYNLLDAEAVGFQTAAGISAGVDFAHVVQSYTIVSRPTPDRYSLFSHSKNRYTVSSNASKFRFEMDR